MHPDRPEAAAHMVTVAMAGHAANGDARHWFEQAINAQVDYDAAWVNYRQSLLPRWGGSHEEMLELGRLALATGRFDTDVPHRYYYQLWSIAWDSDGDWGAVRRFGPSIWNGLEQLYAGIIPPLVERDRWNANAYAAERLAAAWALHAWDNAAALLAPGGEGQGVDSTPFRAWAFARVGATPEAALAEIAARTGAQKTAVARADSLSERGNADAAVAALRKALDSLPADDPGRPFLEMRLREQEFLALLSEAPAGEWIDLPTDLAWWGVVEGDWRSEEGKLIATVEPDNRTADERWGKAAGQPLLVFLPRMPEAYEVQASFPIPKNADGQPCITARVGLWPGWGAYEGGSVRLGQYMNMMQFNPGGAGRRQEVAMNSTQAVPVLRIRVSPDGSTATWLNERIRSERLSRMTPRHGITPRHIAITTMGLHVGDELVVERLQVRRPGR
jgi:hypothetical protein